MVINVNTLTPSGYPSPNVNIDIPDTRVSFRTAGTTAAGFPSMNTRLALAALETIKGLVRQNGLRKMLIDVHDGYLGYGPWTIEVSPRLSLANFTWSSQQHS